MTSLDKIIRRVRWRIAHPQEGDSIGPLLGPVLPLGKIEDAEKVLGYKLPPLLKRLCMEIGDGGFGPELSNLSGIVSAFEQHQSQGWKERWNDWPASMAEIAYFGGESYAFIDLSSPNYNMFYFDGVLEGQLEDIEAEDEVIFYLTSGLTSYNLTFDEWIDRWARGYDTYMPEELETSGESWDVGLSPAGDTNAIGSHKEVVESISEVVPYAQFPPPDHGRPHRWPQLHHKGQFR